ncbi:FIST signal transduction protein [Gorillibacterium timonense]|uniref:FIST signal transduction protein n=1 Tax=Gorillibacterium timonense TaxID=1689269 RepID=UPI00071DD0C5|nr:FIST N-terminal domain-containing protein [Gorillibacterium timonense]
MKAIRFNNAEEAAAHVTHQADPETSYVLFASVRHVKELAEAKLPRTVLCSTAGEYSTRGYENGVVSGFSYPTRLAEIVEIGIPPIRSLEALEKAYSKVEANPNAFMLLLCDGLGGTEESVLSTFFPLHPDFKIIGGSAGDNLEFQETCIYLSGRRVKNVALLFSPTAKTHLIKENIYTPTGTTLLVTKADALGRRVYTFNNKPAAAEYARVLGVEEARLADSFIHHPLGKEYHDDIFIASPMKVNQDRSITFYCELMANTFVHLLKPLDSIETLTETLTQAPAKPSFVFAVHCILRSLKFQQEGLWPLTDSKLLAYCPNTTGFVSYGEQYYRRHANQTMVMLVVEGEEAACSA